MRIEFKEFIKVIQTWQQKVANIIILNCTIFCELTSFCLFPSSKILALTSLFQKSKILQNICHWKSGLNMSLNLVSISWWNFTRFIRRYYALISRFLFEFLKSFYFNLSMLILFFLIHSCICRIHSFSWFYWWSLSS